MLIDRYFYPRSIKSKILDTNSMSGDTWLITLSHFIVEYASPNIHHVQKGKTNNHIFSATKPNAGTTIIGSIGYKVFRLVKRNVIGRSFNLGRLYCIYQTAVTCEDWINWTLPILQSCRCWHFGNNAPSRNSETLNVGQLECDRIRRAFLGWIFETATVMVLLFTRDCRAYAG